MRTALAVTIVCMLSGSAAADLDRKGVRINGGISEIFLGDSAAPSQAGQAIPFEPSFGIGAFITQRFSHVFSIQPEVRFHEMRGFAEDCSVGGSGCMRLFDVTIFMLDIPVLARLDLLPSDNTKLHLDLGPVFALPLGGAFYMGDDTIPLEHMNPINLGVVTGVGVEFAAGPGFVALDFRYQRYALVLAAPADESDDTSSGHQLALSIGYGFP
jgi:hypothetical protein